MVVAIVALAVAGLAPTALRGPADVAHRGAAAAAMLLGVDPVAVLLAAALAGIAWPPSDDGWRGLAGRVIARRGGRPPGKVGGAIGIGGLGASGSRASGCRPSSCCSSRSGCCPSGAAMSWSRSCVPTWCGAGLSATSNCWMPWRSARSRPGRSTRRPRSSATCCRRAGCGRCDGRDLHARVRRRGAGPSVRAEAARLAGRAGHPGRDECRVTGVDRGGDRSAGPYHRRGRSHARPRRRLIRSCCCGGRAPPSL